MRKKHWDEVLQCTCGARFKSYTSQAFHRHNFPMLCKRVMRKWPMTIIRDKQNENEGRNEPQEKNKHYGNG